VTLCAEALLRAVKNSLEGCREAQVIDGRRDNQQIALHSDMEEIIDALLECDLLIIASPVYHLSFPAPLKAIFDRTQQCFCAYRHGRSPFADKQRQAVVLLTAGAPSETGEIIRRQLKWLLPPLNALLSGMVVCANTDEEGITRDAIDRAIALAESVFGTAGADKDDEPE